MGRYFEDLQVGDEFASPHGWTVTAEAILAFAALYDPQRFHLDAEAAAETHFGGLVASGFQTLAIGFRLFCDTGAVEGTNLGSPGMDEVRWPMPVRPGDTLRTTARVLEARPSTSRPDRGIVRLGFRTTNQRGEDVAVCSGTIFVLKRTPLA